MTSQAEFIANTTPPRPVAGVVAMSLDGSGTPQAVATTNPLPVTMVAGGGGSGVAGKTLEGTIGTTAGAIIPAGTFTGLVTIQNTHASNNLFVSFNTPTAASFKIAPGAALTLAFGPTNALNGLGSAASTTFAAIGS